MSTLPERRHDASVPCPAGHAATKSSVSLPPREAQRDSVRRNPRGWAGGPLDREPTPGRSSHRAGDAAIDAQVLPRDVAAGIGDEERDRLGDLFNGTVPAQRYPALELRLFRQAVDETRQDIVHAYAGGGVPVCVQLGEGGKPGAKYTRCRKRQFRLEGGKGRDVDDRALALLLHLRSYQTAHPDHVEKEELHAEVPVVVRNCQQLTLGAVSGTVDDGLDPPPAIERHVHQPFEVADLAIRTGHADTAKRLAQRLTLPG